MIKKIWFAILYLIVATSSTGQRTISTSFDNRLHELLSFSIPTIDVPDAFENSTDYVFLDARELNEYQISHIPGARYIGYDYFSPKNLNNLQLDQKIIIYCSVGYRSEKLGERLYRMGYTNVYNLYGSIFEWVNCGLPVENSAGIVTDSIHTYNGSWSKWVEHPEVTKVW